MIGLAIDDHRLADAIEEHHPSHRRQRGGAEQPVISPRITAYDAAGGHAAEAVGDEPFFVEVRLELAVGFN